MSKELISILICDGLLSILLLLSYKFPTKRNECVVWISYKTFVQKPDTLGLYPAFCFKILVDCAHTNYNNAFNLISCGRTLDRNPPIYLMFFMSEFISKQLIISNRNSKYRLPQTGKRIPILPNAAAVA